MYQCKNCGKILDESCSFCTGCGAALTADSILPDDQVAPPSVGGTSPADSAPYTKSAPSQPEAGTPAQMPNPAQMPPSGQPVPPAGGQPYAGYETQQPPYTANTGYPPQPPYPGYPYGGQYPPYYPYGYPPLPYGKSNPNYGMLIWAILLVVFGGLISMVLGIVSICLWASARKAPTAEDYDAKLGPVMVLNVIGTIFAVLGLISIFF